MPDPFNSDQYLDLDFDTSYDEAEAWQDALKNDGGADVARERRAPRGRMRFFYLATVVVIGILSLRLLSLQVFNSSENRALAEGNRIREVEIPAPRGVVYDAKRGIIARNVANFEVLINPSELPSDDADRNTVYATLAAVLGKPVGEIQQKAEAKGLRYGQELLIADKIPRDQSILLRVRAGNLGGVHLENNPQRTYRKPLLYSHLLGYTGRVSEEDLKRDPNINEADYIGKTGLELWYNDLLSGQAGKRRVEVNAAGQSIKDLAQADPTPGKNLVLSVDPTLQDTAYKAVEKAIKTSPQKATGGTAIVINPKNGEVMSMVSLPGFDNNLFINGIKEGQYRSLADDPDKPLFNRPLSGEYPPGSTFKIITATAGLAEGVIAPDTFVSSPPVLKVAGYEFPDWKETGHGTVNVIGALAESSDVFFYKVSGGTPDQRGVGEKKLADYMRQYHIGSPSGIDLPDEHPGLVPSDKYKRDTFHEPWYIGDTYHMGIGQGFVLVTPLQVANWTATIAGGGIAYKPHLVKALENPDNRNDREMVQPEQLINLKVEPSVVNTIKEGMRQAVESGSGTSTPLQSLPVSVCGKTGSAEFDNETRSHAWFTAFAPCDNPQIVVTVMIEGGGEGAESALPAAKTILEQFFHVTKNPIAEQEASGSGSTGRIKTSD